MQSGWDLPKLRVSDIRRPLVSAFASRKPPNGSLSNRAEALKVGLEHVGGMTYPIWSEVRQELRLQIKDVWLVSFSGYFSTHESKEAEW